jgi:hypothetical protein
MGQPRFVPITIQVDDGQATPKVVALKNVFDDVDKAGTRAASGGLKNAFDGSSLLRSELSSITQQIPILGSFINGLNTDLIRFAKESGAAGGSTRKLATDIAVSFRNADAEVITISGNVKKLSQAYNVFETQLGRAAARGQTSFAGLNTEGALRKPEEAFGRFVSNLQDVQRAEDRTAMAAEALGASNTKLVPHLEAATVGLKEQEAAAVANSTGMAGMLGPIALVIAILAALVVGGVLAGKTMFDLSKHASEVGSKVYDAQQKLNFTAETLGVLSIGAQLSGTTFESLSGSLAIFNKNITLANEGDTKLAKQFRDFNVDISNNEKALRSVFRVLSQLPEGAKQTELAMLAFGRSGKDVLGVVKETNGDLDLAIAKYSAMGLLLSGDATRAADKFGDQLTVLNLQIDMVKVRLGQQFMPIVSDVITRLSKFLEENQGKWATWANSVIDSVKDVKVASEDLWDFFATSIVPGVDLRASGFGELAQLAIDAERLVSGLTKVLDLLAAYRSFTRDPGPGAIQLPEGIQKDIDKATQPVPLRQGGFTTEQLEGFTKELTPFQQRLEAVTARVETFGQTTHVAAEMQFQLKNSIKDLSPEVQAAAAKINAQSLALARQLDQLEANKKANEEAVKLAEKTTQANENFAAGTEAVRQRIASLAETEGAARTELQKFTEAFITFKDRGLIKPEEIKAREDALKSLDEQLDKTLNKKRLDRAIEFRREVSNSLESIGSNVAQAVAAALPDNEQKLLERHAILVRTARSIEGINNLKIDREKFAGITQMFKAAPDAVDLGAALLEVRKQLAGVLGDLGPEKFEATAKAIVDLLKGGAQADRALLDAATPLGQAQRQLNDEFKRLQNEVPIAAETAALRYQIAWQDANNAVALASDTAVVQQIYNQAKLADATVYHADQANAAVIDFLASQRSVTEVIADAKIGVIQSTFDLIDRGLDKFTSKLGIMGSLVKELLSGFIRLALSKFFQSTQGGGGQGQSTGGAGGILGFLGKLTGGFRSGGNAPPLTQGVLTGGFAGGPGAGGFFGSGGVSNPFSGFLTGGGITAPASLSGAAAGQAATISAVQQGMANAALSGMSGGVAAGAGSAGLLGGMPGLAAMLPLLGAGLGSGLGGSSRFGSILGGAGGLIAGGIGAAFLAPGLFAATGALGSMGPMIAGLLTNPVTAIAAVALLVGAVALGKNAARRRDETKRDEISNNTGTEIWKLIGEARSLGTTAALARWDEIAANYSQQIAAIKDSKTKRNAQLQWTNDFLPLKKIVEQRAMEGDKAKDFSSAFIPTFAMGGLVPYRGGMSTLIKVRPGEVMIPPGGFGFTVPGTDHGYDSVYTHARPGTRVLNKSQQRSAPGFAAGGVVGGEPPAGPVVIESMTVQLQMDTDGMVKAVLKSAGGREIIAHQLKVEIQKEGRAGVLGDIEDGLTKRV